MARAAVIMVGAGAVAYAVIHITVAYAVAYARIRPASGHRAA